MDNLPNVIPASEFVEDAAPHPESNADTGNMPDVIPANEFVSDEDKYGTTGQQLKTALEHAASSATFGLSTALETGLGIAKPEAIRARTEENPGVALAGDIGSLIIPGAPEVKALGLVGKGAAKAVGLGLEGAGIASKIGAHAIAGAAENALFQAGDEASRYFSEDPNQSAQTAITDIGLSGLLGAAFGTGFGSVHELFPSSKASKFVAEMKSRLQEHLENPELGSKTAEELSDFHKSTMKGSEDLYRGSYTPDGLRVPSVKDQAIAKLVPELNDTILDRGVGDVMNKVSDQIEKMKADTDTYQPKFTKALEKDLSKWQEAVNKPEVTSKDIYFATEDLKRNLQERSKIGIPIDHTNPAFDSIKSYKNLASDLRKHLEDSSIWGEAGKFQQTTNKAFSDFLPSLKDFHQSFTTKIEGKNVVDPDKVASYLNQISKEKGAIRSEKLQNFLESAEKYRDAINGAHESIGVDHPYDSTALNSVNSALGNMTPGAKAADKLIGVLNSAGSTGSAAIGGMFGGLPGYLIGKEAIGPLADKALPSLLRPLLSSEASGTAFKHALDYIKAFGKGEYLVVKGVKDVLNPEKVDSLDKHQPTQKDRDKLNQTLKQLKEDPSGMANIGGDLGGYLPDHGQALAQTAASVLNFLNSQRPSVTKAAPLDPEPTISPLANDAWNRTLNVAEQPLSILKHIKNGTIQPADIKALQGMYPALYQRLSTELLSQAAESISKSKPIPYKTKMGMSLFAMQPLDSTMSPQGIQAAQSTFNQQQPQQPQQPQHRKVTDGAAKTLQKTSQQYLTPNEARSVARSSPR